METGDIVSTVAWQKARWRRCPADFYFLLPTQDFAVRFVQTCLKTLAVKRADHRAIFGFAQTSRSDHREVVILQQNRLGHWLSFLTSRGSRTFVLASIPRVRLLGLTLGL